MVCGSSVAQRQLAEELRRFEAELAEERKKIQEKDAQLASVRECLREQMQGSEEEGPQDAARSLQELRAELEARRLQHQRELEDQRLQLEEEHRAELQTLMQGREFVRASGEGSPAMQDARARRAAAEHTHEALMERLRDLAQAEAARHRAEAEAAERELREIREQLLPLMAERERAAEELRNARHLLRAEMLERSSATGEATALERRLAEAQDEHVRSEQRYADLAHQLRAQMRDLQAELRTRTEELWHRNGELLQREQELLDVNCQLADLQGLFDDVNRQLQSECGRIEKLQETVVTCTKQKHEMEQLQSMLEDSHKMISQVRDALEQERAERARAAGQLQQEQHRTQLLLEALKHFKEKLQGLTPQALLNRLATSQPQLMGALGIAEPRAVVRQLSPQDGRMQFRQLSPQEPRLLSPQEPVLVRQLSSQGPLTQVRQLSPQEPRVLVRQLSSHERLPQVRQLSPQRVLVRQASAQEPLGQFSPQEPKVLLSRLGGTGGTADAKARSLSELAPPSPWRRPSATAVNVGGLSPPRLAVA